MNVPGKPAKQKDKMRTCLVCGKEFQAKRDNHIYCSKSCRSRACYLRHRDYYREYTHRYYKKHEDYYKKYYTDNKEKLSEQKHKWYRKYKLKKGFEIPELDVDEFIETCTGTDCPFNFNCFHCPAPDCVAD